MAKDDDVVARIQAKMADEKRTRPQREKAAAESLQRDLELAWAQRQGKN